METIYTKAPTADGELTSKNKYEFGGTLDEAIELYGEEVVFSYYKAQARVHVQGKIRAMLRAGKSEAEVQTALDKHKLGVVQRDPAKSREKAKKSVLELMKTEEGQAELRRLIEEAKAAKKS